MSDYDLDQMDDEQLDEAFEETMLSIESMDRLQQSIASNRTTDRQTMMSLEQMQPEAIHANHPVASYTYDPSDQNLTYSLEAFSVGKALAAVSAGGILGAIIMYLVKLFRNDNVEQKVKDVQNASDRLKDQKKTTRKEIKDIKRDDLSEKSQYQYDLLMDDNLSTIVGDDIKEATSNAVGFLSAVAPGGGIFKILAEWESKINDRYKDFTARFNDIADVIENMYEYDDKRQVEAAIKRLKKATLQENDLFMEESRQLYNRIRRYASGESFSQFIKEEVVGSDAYYEMALDYERWIDKVKDIYPSSFKQLQKNLDQLEEKAQSLKEGKEEAYRKAKKKRTRKTQDDEGNINIDIDGLGVSPELEKRVSRAQHAMKTEAKAIQTYRQSLNQIVTFYRQLITDADKLQATKRQMLRQLANET